MSTDAAREDTWVSVQLSECGAEDARTVFTALATAFGGTGETDCHGVSGARGRDPVWTSHFDTAEAEAGGGAGGPRLKHAVAVELQGSPASVEILKRALSGTFRVSDERMASGDQEEQTWLRLTSA
ncbi:hypothetical protein GCM10009801_41630 [Streptomyces albiaxialis]|uniref:Uncharacterized protein n=1 Tax=Streptomyces albiaxialis TaxID=329523 RepID=A0ABN2W4W9_9ACTN